MDCLSIACALAASGILVVAPLPPRTVVLGSGTITSGGGFPSYQPHRFKPVLGFDHHAEELFEDVFLDSTSVGRWIVADASTDSDFVAVADTLTNGWSEQICVSMIFPVGGPGVCPSEPSFFGLVSRDFRGAEIRALRLRLDALTFEEPNQIGGTSATGTFTIEVLGSPAALLATWGQIKSQYR